MMTKTKIVCTLGPATDREGILSDILKAGMNVARFNFSHENHENHLMRLNRLKALREELRLPVAAMLDTKGPEIRLKKFVKGRVELVEGQNFTLTTRDVVGTEEICAISYKKLPEDVTVGDRVMIDDGLISLRIIDLTETDILCRVENGGMIKDRKGINVPGVHLSMPYMSEEDRADILFGIQEGYDIVAASFCSSKEDVQTIRHFIDSYGGNMLIIAKIENQAGVDNIEEIFEAADGVMIARGDMGVEIDFTEIPIIQKAICRQGQEKGKTVITATHMLDSMISNPRPTRAEITDVANAVYDGTSAIMLSGETAAGQYPTEAVRTMVAIAARTEKVINYFGQGPSDPMAGNLGISGATAHAACTTAAVTGAHAILTVTKNGSTAQHISKYRPNNRIIACVMQPEIQRHLAITWGVTPILMDYAKSTDEMIEFSIEAAKKESLIKDGDIVVITSGVPIGISGTTNMIKVQTVGQTDGM